MKKYLFIAASALALASCSSEDFVGTEGGNVENGANKAIGFGGKLGKITRANDHVGADAAQLLNNNFIVAGYKSGATAPTSGISTNKVFDHYNIKWTANSAGTTADNTADWNYVGGTPYTGLTELKGTLQTIKYWDYSAAQYDYVAFSTGKITGITTGTPKNDTEVLLSKVTPASATTAPTQTKDKVSGGAYTITGTAKALSGCYIADLITAYKGTDYSQEVKLTFRNLTTKARVAFYETVPGYSVKNVKFHQAEATTANKPITPATATSATLYTTGTGANDKFFTAGTAGIYFPPVGSSNKGKDSDYNKAHVKFFPTSSENTLSFGNVNYDTAGSPITGALKKTSKDPSFAGTKENNNYYQTVIPNEDGTTLTLCVDYTLVADDGSNEEIHVYGAKAIIPAIYAQWKSNYAYTYIFKISDNTNGWTSTDQEKQGLFPITFNAVVVDAEENEQSTITTVATPSITTYQKGHRHNDADEYSAANGDIYVRVMDGKTIKEDLSTNAKLYTVKADANVPVSEATVHDALTIGVTTNQAAQDKVEGRNGITLTKVDLKTGITAIPGVDGNDIKVNQESKSDAVSFTPDKTTTTTYAFVYKTKVGTDEQFVSTRIATDADTNVTAGTYFTDRDCKIDAGTTLTKGTTYYYKVNKNTNTYAVKVIKVVK